MRSASVSGDDDSEKDDFRLLEPSCLSNAGKGDSERDEGSLMIFVGVVTSGLLDSLERERLSRFKGV